jgi:hypothetical protein
MWRRYPRITDSDEILYNRNFTTKRANPSGKAACSALR